MGGTSRKQKKPKQSKLIRERERTSLKWLLVSDSSVAHQYTELFGIWREQNPDPSHPDSDCYQFTRDLDFGLTSNLVRVSALTPEVRFRNCSTAIYRGEGIFFLFFSYANPGSFINAQRWLSEQERYTSDQWHRILVGLDFASPEAQVKQSDVEKMVDQNALNGLYNLEPHPPADLINEIFKKTTISWFEEFRDDDSKSPVDLDQIKVEKLLLQYQVLKSLNSKEYFKFRESWKEIEHIGIITNQGLTLLDLSISKNDVETFKAALELSHLSSSITPALMVKAISSKNSQFVQALFETGKFKKSSFSDYRTSRSFLHDAVVDEDSTKFLLSKGVDPNIKDCNGRTPLAELFQCSSWNSQVAEILLEKGARDSNFKLSNFSPGDHMTRDVFHNRKAWDLNLLFLAILVTQPSNCFKPDEKVKWLLKKNPSLAFTVDQDGRPPLYYITHLRMSGQGALVFEILLDFGCVMFTEKEETSPVELWKKPELIRAFPNHFFARQNMCRITLKYCWLRTKYLRFVLHKDLWSYIGKALFEVLGLEMSFVERNCA